MKLQPIVDRLTDQVPALKAVERVGDLLAAQGNVRTSPAAFVYNTTETAGDNPYAQITRQEVTENFAVVIAAKNVSDQRGGAAADDLDLLIDAVKAALIGWHHPEMESETLYVRGRAIPGLAKTQTAWWLAEFKATVHHQSS